MSCGIYLIVNLITNKFYVGSAIDIEARWRTHNYDLNKNQHHSPRLQNAYNKYGADNFSCVVLEETSENTRIEREQFWIDYTKCCDTGYNACKIAGATTGYKHTKENKELMRKLKLGGKLSLNHLRKIKEATVGLKRSQETKDRISKARKGMKFSKETKKKISDANRNFEKWPHEKGYRCECDECKLKRSEYMRNWKKQRKV